MRQSLRSLILFISILSISSCAALQMGISTAGNAVAQASYLGHRAADIVGDVSRLRSFVGARKTAYSFELVGVTNNGGIASGEIVHATAGGQSRANSRRSK